MMSVGLKIMDCHHGDRSHEKLEAPQALFRTHSGLHRPLHYSNYPRSVDFSLRDRSHPGESTRAATCEIGPDRLRRVVVAQAIMLPAWTMRSPPTKPAVPPPLLRAEQRAKEAEAAKHHPGSPVRAAF